ncbi:hypothetical protein F0562_035845 [Nyssa sinensis]|uniref:non-specific serine/threonine protein kinase n=1 Tax=Nyssa sinensis TaxID=561372 RepID=A0A5J5ACY6_9ASTE|nr:hypothetical protein F0562_035845 [Nyssa sinensis]
MPKNLMSSIDEPVKEFKLDCSSQAPKQLDRVYKKKGGNWSLRFLLWFACAVGLIEIISVVMVWCFLYRTHQQSVAPMNGYMLAATGFRKFKYSELKKATRGFSEEIGRGGGGVVYKGELADHRVAAIKQLNTANQGEAEFLAEVSTIGRLNHMNLIEVWGYCVEGKNRLLVYEYMEHGSLAENLSANTLDWEKRFEIAVGTAKGLAYLHEECLEWVLHCDVKPQNILLDSNHQPKVADFGLSKLLNRVGENNSSFSRIRGTRGYMAPEWISNLPITSKVDVYSYGVVVLEMVTGNSPTTGVHAIGNAGGREQTQLVNWVREKINGGASTTSWIEEIADPTMEGSSLSVEKPEDILISPNGLFSAGFHPVGVNAYCFAIWFTKPSNGRHNRTIVWVANRDQPVNGKLSKFSLLKDGNLILTDADGSIFWATSTVSASSVQLHLHDSGNLVLLNSDGVILWQSFDSPTDTLLPKQALTKYTKLVSSRSQTNHSSGFYKMLFGDDNVLRLIYDGPDTSSIYWPDPWLLSYEAGRSRYNDTRIAVFDSRGHFLSSDRVEFLAADFGLGIQRRLILDFDGNLRLYSLQETTGTWVVSWHAMTKPCGIHNSCGPNSLCNYDPFSGRKCSCLPKFKMKNQTDWSYGCEPKFNLSCNPSEVAFVEVLHSEFYGYNIKILRNYSFESCKRKCLEFCDCLGFQHKFEDDGVYYCYPKRVFRTGHNSPSFIQTLYLKVPINLQSSIDEPEKEFKLDCSRQVTKQLERVYKKRRENRSLKFLLWFASAIGGVEIICISLMCCFLYRTHQKSGEAKNGYLLAATGFRKFTYSELNKATRGFREEIGRGGGGVVYKGVLADHRVAAIKRLNEANQGEAEFLAEVSTIGRLNHMNLIEMWGYCVEGKHRLLVYEYMDHGSLAENLYSNALDWEKRFEIAVGTAKGLAYLHEECLEWVLHCDVKPPNILLDSNYQPKVADFGLSKLLNRGGENISSFSRIRGTRGYMAPEWIFNLPITSKVDVYSYGVVVLEMVTGKSPATGIHAIGEGREMEQGRLVEWVREKINGGGLTSSWMEEIIAPMMSGKYDMGRMEILVRVALQCVEEDKDARPTMSQVLEMLLRHQNDY